MSSSPQTRIEALQAAISARLKRVCYDWPLDRFEKMVRNLALITVKYERHLLPYNGVSTDEMVSQMKALRQRSAEHRRRSGDRTDLSPGF